MSEKQLRKAQQLIDKRKYDQARKILQPLAFSNPQAEQMLQRLNTIAPPSEKKGGGGGKFLFGLGFFSCVGCVGLPVLVVIGIAVALATSLGAQQDEAEKANEGRGSKDNPIAANSKIVFDDFDIELGEFVFPASTDVERMNMFNEDPAAGTDYALLWVKFTCKKEGSEECSGSTIDVSLLDDQDNEWDSPSFLVLEDGLFAKEAIGGSSIGGWTVIEFPNDGRQPTLVKVSTLIGPSLYVELPTQEQ